MDNSKLRYPRKSHRKIIKTPPDSAELAEFFGIIFGDGGINSNWQLVISLNSKLDADYAKYISNLINKLFGIKPSVRKRPNQNTLVIVTSSMNLLDFLVLKGAVRGNKIIQQISIPDWIKNNYSFVKAFVKGLVDTDGCLYIHKHYTKGIYYKNIGFCLASFSVRLINEAAEIFRTFDINFKIADRNRRIYLYNYPSVIKYMDIFGSSNPRILNKYKEWKGARVV